MQLFPFHSHLEKSPSREFIKQSSGSTLELNQAPRSHFIHVYHATSFARGDTLLCNSIVFAVNISSLLFLLFNFVILILIILILYTIVLSVLLHISFREIQEA